MRRTQYVCENNMGGMKSGEIRIESSGGRIMVEQTVRSHSTPPHSLLKGAYEVTRSLQHLPFASSLSKYYVVLDITTLSDRVFRAHKRKWKKHNFGKKTH